MLGSLFNKALVLSGFCWYFLFENFNEYIQDFHQKFKIPLKIQKKVKISYQKVLILDFKVQRIPTRGSESV